MVIEATGKIDRPKVVVIGLDCVPPQLFFQEPGIELKNLKTLMEHGIWGTMRSTDPPITIPAWTTITTGKDPGELGLYGFRNRQCHDYSEMVTVNSSHVDAPRIWDYLESVGMRSILIGIPQTYPPLPHNGITIAGLPTPDLEQTYTYPSNFANQLSELAGGDYLTDVRDFRTADKNRVLAELFESVERRFELARHFLTHEPWNFFMLVEIATDRLHHSFWRYWARDHRLYTCGNPYEEVIPEFYRFVDDKLGSLLDLLNDDTTVFVVSDHGVRTLIGGVAVNEWLIREGLLTLKHTPEHETPLTQDMIDWDRTKAWGEGGYYSRIFINLKGREPRGVIEPSEYNGFRDELASRLSAMPDENHCLMNNVVLQPEQIYRSCRNVPPDLMVYFDGLSRRSIGNVGAGQIFWAGDTRGLDDANHDREGIFVMARMHDVRGGERTGIQIQGISCLDVTPTILHQYGLSIPEDLGGSVFGLNMPSPCVVGRHAGPRIQAPQDEGTFQQPHVKGFTAEEEAVVKQRLEDLGYL